MEGKEENKKDRGSLITLVIICILIGIIIGAIISPFINDLFASKTPIYKEYSRYESEDTIVYTNEDLEVQITFDKETRWYEAENQEIHTIGHSPSELYDNILNYSEDLSENQLRWFDYMLNNVLQ